MRREYAPLNGVQRFEVGDEVIGDEHIRGTILATKDVSHPGVAGCADTIREYLVKNERGEKFLYAGEINLRLVKKGLGDAAPPRLEFLKELDRDLKYRPLAGLRA
jgi:hypothetical protein